MRGGTRVGVAAERRERGHYSLRKSSGPTKKHNGEYFSLGSKYRVGRKRTDG